MNSGRARTYSSRVVVLRTYDLGESDRILVLATNERGLVRAVAKGVRKTASRFGSRLEPFMVSDCHLAEGRSLDRVTQAVSVASYGIGIVQDYDAFMYASALAELTEVLWRDDPQAEYFDLVHGAVAALARRRYPPQQVFDAFALRAMARSGWDMSVDACAVTGETQGLTSFSPSHGGVLSTALVRLPGATILRPGTRELLSSLKSGDWSSVLASDEAARRQAHQLVRAYLGWHLEKTISTLTRLDRQP